MSTEETGKMIISIHYGKKKVEVTLNNGESFFLSKDAFTDMPLYEGKILNDQDALSLASLAKEDKFMSMATKYVLKESHSIMETKQYLYRKGAEPKVVFKIVDRLTELGYLDDLLFAKTYARDVAGLKLYGRNRIMMELKEKGLSDEIIAQLEFDPARELSKARRYARLANSKYAKNPNTKKMYKVHMALLRRGFDEDIALEAAQLEFTSGDPDLERERLKNDAQRVKARYSKKYAGYDLYRRVLTSLVRKGYAYEMVKEALKENEDEDFGNE